MTSPQAAATPAKGYIPIAAEQAFAPAGMLRIYRQILDGPHPDPGVVSLPGFYMSSQNERARDQIQTSADAACRLK